MRHEGAALAPVPKGLPALAQNVWAAASESAQAIADVPQSAGEVGSSSPSSARQSGQGVRLSEVMSRCRFVLQASSRRRRSRR